MTSKRRRLRTLRASAGRFSEFRAGLDHVEFLAASREDLDGLGRAVGRAGNRPFRVKEPGYTSNAVITFGDPDSIQLDFFWPATGQ